MDVQKVNLCQNKNLNFQGRVNVETLRSIRNAMGIAVEKKRFWEGCRRDLSPSLFIESWDRTQNNISSFYNQIIDKMKYFAKDCELYITEKNAFIKHPKSNFVQFVSEYEKFNTSKFIKDFEKIDPQISNSYFCSQRHDKISRNLFAPEVDKFNDVYAINPDKIAEDEFRLEF